MNENRVLPARSGTVYWRDPDKEVPPRGTKLLILTSGGVTVIGDWITTSNYIAWSPMPKRRKRQRRPV
jgi:hypothetical protein